MAFHEAGHAVATMVVHPRSAIELVTINGSGDVPGYLLGRRRTRGRLSPRSPESVKRRVRADIVSLHGATWSQMHAERALATMRGKTTRHRQAAVLGDILEAIDLAWKITGDEAKTEHLTDRLGHKAREIIEGCWPQVVAIARALVDKGTLDRDELWAVARTPDPDADPWDAFDDLVLSLKLPKGEPERLRAVIARRDGSAPR